MLKDTDDKDQQIITQQLLHTESLFEDIRKFQDKITTYDSMAKKKISNILMEHDFFQKASWVVKNRLLSGCAYCLFVKPCLILIVYL